MSKGPNKDGRARPLASSSLALSSRIACLRWKPVRATISSKLCLFQPSDRGVTIPDRHNQFRSYRHAHLSHHRSLRCFAGS